MARPVPLRGVIEGFYGPPWSHDARLDVIEFVAERGMNAYVYAPKDDPKHRERWRDHYDDSEVARFADLAVRAAKVGVRFGFAISPGLDVDHAAEADRRALLAKFVRLLAGGVDWFVLALDDIPVTPALGARQGELVAWLCDGLAREAPDAMLMLVPTEYVGAVDSPYLRDLAASLPSGVDVMWTGPTVCSPVVTQADARARADVMGGRPPVLWDNYPVNDGLMARSLHLGPYRGREPGLSDAVAGVLANPMVQPRASKVALATVADYLRDPEHYDPAESWERAIADVGGRHAGALRPLARACADGPLMPASELAAARLVDAVEDELDGPGWIGPVASLRDELEALRAGSDALPADDPLGAELRPWLEQARLEADAALAALRLVQQVRPVARRDGTGCRVAAPNASLAFLHVFAVMLAWSAARSGRDRVVLGARFAIHPAVVALAGGRPGVDVGLALHEDESVVDRLCRLALADYERWREHGEAPARVVTVAGEPACDENGLYSVGDHDVLLARSGSRVTRIVGAGDPPFPDSRIT